MDQGSPRPAGMRWVYFREKKNETSVKTSHRTLNL